MLFNSLEFPLFLFVVCLGYFALPPAKRWMLLLSASYFFYMYWRADYAILLVISTVVDFEAAKRIADSPSKVRKRFWLCVSLSSNLGMLFYFKYYNFLAGSLNTLFGAFHQPAALPYSDFLLPVGISFYTFQTMSYVIDVFLGRMPAERHLGYFALFVSYFPQLVAGPIERADRLLPQLRTAHRFDYVHAVEGLRLILWGLFKKVVVADRIAPIVEAVYSDPAGNAGPACLLASILFGFQILCDFSGYSDIALGSARLMGINLMQNFRQPYRATSLRDFWQRWHISLSTWFRDYVYVPLGGNRGSRGRTYRNLLVVFLISGVWHGAAWTFVIWGALHGVLLVAEHALAPVRSAAARLSGLARRPRICTALGMVTTFLLVNVTWVFFRAKSVPDAITLMGRLPQGWRDLASWAQAASLIKQLGTTPAELGITLVSLAVFLGLDQLIHSGRTVPLWRGRHVAVRWACYSILLWWVFLFGQFANTPFLYFAF